ncbi:MAG: ABC-F family ATP-binding cassette domain-containing protein [Acidimicrobiia bacterium]|nr:MAG: ABC-F family ATP-binding cassette domain-containing protein [Acidimicrobiia bacterium]
MPGADRRRRAGTNPEVFDPHAFHHHPRPLDATCRPDRYPPVIIARGVSIEAGHRVLLTDADCALHPGDRVGLVGRNGAGKTTLLKTLAGLRPASAGTIARSGRIGYLSQEAALPELEPAEATGLERVLAAREVGRLQHRMEDTRRRMESATGEERDRLIRRYSRLEDEFQVVGGYAAEAEARRFAAAVGITDDEMAQPVRTMSGGQRRRVELARILFAETEVLLLDEPTNHLDLDAKAWLVGFLTEYRGALLVVSHDLPLLDAAITSVLALENGALEGYRGDYSFYLAERERRREQRIRENAVRQRQIEQLETTVRRFKNATEKMAKRAKAMQTRADRMKGGLVEVAGRAKRVKVDFPQPDPSGRIPLEAVGLAKAFDDNVVFVDVGLHLERGERLIIMGLNGAGKTTLLRILAGEETADIGEVRLGHNATLGYYAQEHEQIRPGVSVMDHVRSVGGGWTDLSLRSVLGHFLLADKVDQDAGTLSGGEKTKLALAMLVVAGRNLLLLDEPTNNLDPQAKEALLVALRHYAGTVVLVSHDTDFVAALGPDRAVMMPEGDSVYFDESLLDLVALA